MLKWLVIIMEEASEHFLALPSFPRALETEDTRFGVRTPKLTIPILVL